MSSRVAQLSSHLARTHYFHTTAKAAMSINTKTHNRSGLTAEESKNLTPRQPANEEERSILAKLRTLYESSERKLSEDTYSMFAEQATFHDPVGIATPLGQIKEQFNGLAKIFEKATVDKQSLLTNPPNLPDSTLLVDQVVTYYRDAKKDPTKTVNSLLTVERSGGKVTHLQEEWDHKGEKDASDGFMGQLSEWRKKATTVLSGAFVSQTPPANK